MNNKSKETITTEKALTFAEELMREFGDRKAQIELAEIERMSQSTGGCQFNPDCRYYRPGTACERFNTKKCVGKISKD